MQRNQPTIYIRTRSMKEIRDKLIPYFCPSMYYKLQERKDILYFQDNI